MTSFYTKAGLPRPQEDYAAFYSRLFECVEEIMPKVCYLEIGKDYLADFSRTMIDLGNSTNIMAEDAASTLAKFANITSMDQAQFGNLARRWWIWATTLPPLRPIS